MSQLKVTGYFHFTAAPEDAVSFKIMVPYAAITRTAYGEIKQDPFDLAIRKTCGNTITDIKSDEWMREESLRLEKYNVSTGQWLPFPVTDEVAHVEMFDGLRFRLLKIFPGTEETVQILDEIEVPVIQENPQFFARSETEWTADLRFKNGEYLLLDSVIYVWSYPITGNSVDDPKTDIEKNRLTTKWTAYQEWPFLFTKGIAARYAQFGMGIFYDQYLMSQYGVDSRGNSTGDYRNFGTDDFNPNILLNFLDGSSVLRKTTIYGEIISTHPNGAPAVTFNYNGRLGQTLWYDNSQVQEEQVFVYDDDGNLDGSEVRAYNRDGSLKWRRDSMGVLQSSSLQEYWTVTDSYYFETSNEYAPFDGEGLVAEIGDNNLKGMDVLTPTGKTALFKSVAGANNYGYNNMLCIGFVNNSQLPGNIATSRWLTGYKLESLHAALDRDGYSHRYFHRYINGVATGLVVDVSYKVYEIER